jgi:hypothetical protein
MLFCFQCNAIVDVEGQDIRFGGSFAIYDDTGNNGGDGDGDHDDGDNDGDKEEGDDNDDDDLQERWLGYGDA